MTGLEEVFGEVHTPRLLLRRLRPEDSAALFAIDGDPETHRYNPDGPAPDRASTDRRLREWLRSWDDDGFGYWAVMLPPSDKVIGFGGVRRMSWRDRAVLNLYYRLTPSAWGRGYATEMARMAVTLARTHLPDLPIVAVTRPPNLPSIRTAERAGLLRRPDLGAEHVILALGWPAGEQPSARA